MFKYHKRKKTERRPNSLKQGLEQKHPKLTEAQISTICSLNVFSTVIFI